MEPFLTSEQKCKHKDFIIGRMSKWYNQYSPTPFPKFWQASFKNSLEDAASLKLLNSIFIPFLTIYVQMNNFLKFKTCYYN